jgi:hypothetical protein
MTKEEIEKWTIEFYGSSPKYDRTAEFDNVVAFATFICEKTEQEYTQEISRLQYEVHSLSEALDNVSNHGYA